MGLFTVLPLTLRLHDMTNTMNQAGIQWVKQALFCFCMLKHHTRNTSHAVHPMQYTTCRILIAIHHMQAPLHYRSQILVTCL